MCEVILDLQNTKLRHKYLVPPLRYYHFPLVFCYFVSSQIFI